MAAKKAEKPAPDQGRAFRRAARQLEADESEDRFNNALRTVARQKVEPDATARKRGKKTR